MTIHKADPYPGEIDRISCDFCNGLSEDLCDRHPGIPADWLEVDGEHVCPECQDKAVVWVLKQMRESDKQ